MDFSVLSKKDVGDIILQRTSTLIEFPILGGIAFSAWHHLGARKPIDWIADRYRFKILEHASSEIRDDIGEITSFIARNSSKKIGHITDIGPGHSLSEIFLFEHYQCSFHLVDIESNDLHHHDFNSEGAGYGSLEKSIDLLAANGVPREKIEATNPQKVSLKPISTDLLISLYSCGFHYPLDTYEDFIRGALGENGIAVMDVARQPSEHQAMSRLFSETRIIKNLGRADRILGFAGVNHIG